jgi:hypothetical protein
MWLLPGGDAAAALATAQHCGGSEIAAAVCDAQLELCVGGASSAAGRAICRRLAGSKGSCAPVSGECPTVFVLLCVAAVSATLIHMRTCHVRAAQRGTWPVPHAHDEAFGRLLCLCIQPPPSPMSWLQPSGAVFTDTPRTVHSGLLCAAAQSSWSSSTVQPRHRADLLH